jgi:holo-[acyl-carrier protein] synthase
MIIAHGIDLVEIATTQRLLTEPTNQFLTRCFTHSEQHAAGNGVRRSARLSGRLAVKEAVMKALGTGFGEGIGFLDVEVVDLPSGAPSIVLHRAAALKAEQAGVARWLVSTSHERGMAIASVIGLGS